MAAAQRASARFSTCVCRFSTKHTTRPLVSQIRRDGRRWNRWQSTDAASGNPKITSIVDQIGQLTLLETADLVSLLKSRLNIPDMPMGGFMGGGGGGGGQAAAPPPVEEEEAAPKVEEKTLFNVKLQSFDAAAKPKVIKEIKALLGLSLVDSKKFVESAPKIMRESVTKDDATKMIETMKALGAVVVME